ncbi:MAG: DUF4384 domain-containing protein [Candidatus Bipolaricaulota bacterium]|nr:DUF4384 domain-containing protein [Candidatus Bipolaricaulota bacterium]MDW8329321.1 DUF4384 domain-containing protein [Candidatus Bipolaricaulota bacterium]
MRRLSLFVLGVMLLSLVSGAPSFSQGQPSPLGIVVQPTEFQAFIEVSRPICAVGQTIEIRYRANQAPYYAYILDIQGNNVTRLLPNRFEPNNLVNDTEWKQLPGVMTYQLVCAPPLGPEYVQIIASTERIPQLEGGTGNFPLLGTNPQAVGQQIQAILPQGKVATAVAQLQIVAAGQPQPPQQCPPGTVGTPPNCVPITQPPQTPPSGGQFQVQQVITPGSFQFFQLSAQLMPLLQAAGLSQALAQAQGMAGAAGQPQALGTAPQQINIQAVQNRCEFIGVMRTESTATVSGATLPPGTYLQAFCQVNPYLVVIINVFTGQIVMILVVVPPPFFTPISLLLFIYGWFFPVVPGPYPFPWPYPYPFPWPFPVTLPAACSGLPIQNPFSVPVGSGAPIVNLAGVMTIKDAGGFFNSLAIQSLGPALSFQRITSFFSVQIGFVGSFGTALLPYSTLGTFVLVVQGGGKTVCIQGVVGFGAVYGLAAHN